MNFQTGTSRAMPGSSRRAANRCSCHGCGESNQEAKQIDYPEFIARVASHIPDKGQVAVRYYGLYANAHQGKVRKSSLALFPLCIVEEELQPVPAEAGPR